MATRVLDAEYKFYGVRTKETQALQWPRDLCPDRDCAPDPDGCAYLANDKVPVPVVSATCEMARSSCSWIGRPRLQARESRPRGLM